MMCIEEENSRALDTPEASRVPTEISTADKQKLNDESIELINKIISEKDIDKTKDLTYLFNINQNKKTIIRLNKLNDLMDLLTEQTSRRLTARPDEISNKELLDGMKIIQDLMERGQEQISGSQEEASPMIQLNQQNTEIHLGGEETSLSRESREKVKNAVLNILSGLNTKDSNATIEAEWQESGTENDQ